MAETQDPLEGFPELGVEDCVDDRVEAGVQVAEKRGGLMIEVKVTKREVENSPERRSCQAQC